MTTIPLPVFNVDLLEGAVLHMLQVCDNLSDYAINDFCVTYAKCRGKHNMKSNYASTKLLPRLMKEGKVYRTGTHYYSLNPMVRSNRYAQDAFWIFLEFFDSVDIVMNSLKGPHPAQISYVKDKKIYHIIRVEGDGRKEMAFVSQLEIEQMQRMRKHKDKYPVEERYIFVFDTIEDANNCCIRLQSVTLHCVIEYEEGKFKPMLKFFYPEGSAQVQ